MNKSSANHFGSVKFQEEIRERIDSTMQIALEDIESRLEPIDAQRLDELEARVTELRNRVLPEQQGDNE